MCQHIPPLNLVNGQVTENTNVRAKTSIEGSSPWFIQGELMQPGKL